MLPLSVPRDIDLYKRAALLGMSPSSAGPTTGKECSIAVQLCAPISKRVYSASFTRNQKWGQVPDCAPQIVRSKPITVSTPYGSVPSQQITNVETLLDKEFLGETPELQSDGVTSFFTAHVRYTYGLSNPWLGTASEGGGDDFETLPVGKSPVDRTTAQQNAIVVKGGISTLSPLIDPDQSFYG